MKYLIILCMMCIGQWVVGQNKKDIAVWAEQPKTSKKFPIDYHIALPRLKVGDWDKDYYAYKKFITPAMEKTQIGLSFTNDGVRTWFVGNSVIPHAQLDTTTVIQSPAQLLRNWRMVCYRKIQFKDSVVIAEKTFYRSEKLIEDVSERDDAFAIFKDGQFRLFVRKGNAKDFKQEFSTRYTVENNRSVLLYKWSKGASSVAQIGITEEGYLILQLPMVLEHNKPNEYISYYATVTQFVFEPFKL
jgi:hypothetical protein